MPDDNNVTLPLEIITAPSASCGAVAVRMARHIARPTQARRSTEHKRMVLSTLSVGYAGRPEGPGGLGGTGV